MVDEISMGGDLGFLAYVIHPGEDSARNLWVCLRSTLSGTRSGWLGCWSLVGSDVVADRVRQVVLDLAKVVQRDGRTGPMGPFLDGHHFFEGWETWGVGMPEPLKDLSLDDVTSTVTAQFDADSYSYVDDR
jgi:hypothetical protein